jgi:hypothetical protein
MRAITGRKHSASISQKLRMRKRNPPPLLNQRLRWVMKARRKSKATARKSIAILKITGSLDVGEIAQMVFYGQIIEQAA